MAVDGAITIRISAARDSSIETTFGQIEKRAQRAGGAINKALAGQSSGGRNALAASFDRAGTSADKSARQAERSWNQTLRQLNAVAKNQDGIFARVEANKVKTAEKSARERVRIEQNANKEIERAFRAASREAEREESKRTRATERELGKQQAVRRQFAERVSQRATRFLFPPPMGILGAAGRVANGIMQGAGIDTSIQGGVGRAIQLNSGAVALANQERIATGSTRGAGFYENMARTTGDKFSQNPESQLDLLRAFTGKTGNFDAAGKMSDQLTSISVASGANLTEMGDAAGYVYNQLKNIPGAADKTIAVMRGIVGQTAVGAVEMKDYASQMGRVAANAGTFEGAIDQNILKLSALTQLNIESGGATSAADAARGTVAFANTTSKAARIKAFEAAGVRIFTDDKIVNGQYVRGARRDTKRDPFELLKDSFRATNGNLPQLATMYADVLGRKPLQALSGAYKSAGGGEAGIDAVTKSIDRYMRVNLTPETEKANLKDFENSPAAKAQRFQNNLDKIVATMAERVIPALETLRDPALKVAGALASMIEYVAANPWKSLVLGVGAAIVRAFAEASFRSGIEKAITSGGLGPGAPARAAGGVGGVAGAGGGVTSGGIGVLGNAVAFLQIGTAAIAAYQVGTMYIDSLVAKDVEEQRKGAESEAQAGNDEGQAVQAARSFGGGHLDPEAAKRMGDREAAIQAKIDAAIAYKSQRADLSGDMSGNSFDASSEAGEFGNMIAGISGPSLGSKDAAAAFDASHMEQLRAELAEVRNIMADIRSGVIKVEVTNQPHDGPRVDNGGRGDKDGSTG